MEKFYDVSFGVPPNVSYILGLDHLLQEMLGAVQVFLSQVVIAKGETLLVRNLSNDVK